MAIKIISPTKGLNTSAQIFELMQVYPQGITVQELSNRLNRPVSMLNLCLKSLVASKKILARKNHNQWVYTVNNTKSCLKGIGEWEVGSGKWEVGGNNP